MCCWPIEVHAERRVVVEHDEALDGYDHLDEEVAVGEHVAYIAVHVECVHLDEERWPTGSHCHRTKVAALGHEYAEANDQVDQIDARLDVEKLVQTVDATQPVQNGHAESVGHHRAQANERQHERPPAVNKQQCLVVIHLFLLIK